MAVVVTGVGVVSALGANPAAFRRALIEGVNACALHEFPRIGGSVVKAPAYMAVPAEPEGLIEPKKLRRLFRLARMSAVAARQALKNAELDPASVDPSRLGVCFGTSFGAIEPTQKLVDSWVTNGDANASPLQFTNSVHGIMASQIALDINARGVNLTCAQRDICFEAALDTAVQLLEARRADVIMVGGGDEMTPMLHEFGSATYQLMLSPTEGLDPNGSRRAVLPGDGAAVVVLERDDTPRRALARVAATRLGRCDTGGPNIAQQAWEAAGRPALGLVTTNRDGGARNGRVNADHAAPGNALQVSHRGNFGTYPSAGAQQFVANVLMLSNGEFYRPMANGKPVEVQNAPPKAILHNAPSISGGHAAYVLTA
jgi:3-oxoacyl-(acyl-carrier-protein) synthase